MLPIKQNQTMLDMSVQHTGDLSNLFLLAMANGKSITDDLVPGQELTAVPVTDKRVTRVFDKIEYDVTTAVKPGLILGGIGYMQIGTSFKVS